MPLSKDLVWYTAGPMSGIPQFNYPLFLRVARMLREQGYTVKSPAEMDTPAMQAAALANMTGDLSKLTKEPNETWGDVLARDVKLISDNIGGIIMLPGWERSRGARLELFVGLLTNKQFGVWDNHIDYATPVRREYVQHIIKENMP